MKLSKNIIIGKEIPNSSFGSRMGSYGHAQIYIRCNFHKEGCEDSIAILPNRQSKEDPNDIVDSISDQVAMEIFYANGWEVKGINKAERNCCPSCLNK